MNQPLVSVVMIFLDTERFIEEAIASVFAQSYPNWELLLIDDGSTDASTAIAKAHAARHPERVRYFEHPGHINRGMSTSRNLGISHGRGSYVALIDSDDVWLPGKLEHQVALLEAHPAAGMICGASHYWYGWTGRRADAARDQIVPVGAPPETLFPPPTLLMLLYPLARGAAPCLCSLLVRRDVIEAVNGFEESFRGMYEDQVFLTKLYLETPVFVSSECWDRYRQHDASCVARVTSAQYDGVREHYLSWLGQYLRERGREDSDVWSALDSALARYRRPIRFRIYRLARRLGGPLRSLRTVLRSEAGS